MDGSYGPAIVRASGILPGDERKEDVVQSFKNLAPLGHNDDIIRFPGVYGQLMHRLDTQTIGYYFDVQPIGAEDSAAESARSYEYVIVSPYDAPTIEELNQEFRAGDHDEVIKHYQFEAAQTLAMYEESVRMLESVAPQDPRLMPPTFNS
jgi:hypothetical protein